MKKIIIAVLILVVLSLSLIAQDAVFKAKGDTRNPNVWGWVYHWDGAHWVPGPTHSGSVIKFKHWISYSNYYADYSHPDYEDETAVHNGGYYEFIFEPPFSIINYGVVEISIDGHKKVFDYNGHNHIDIYLPNPYAPYPMPDNTIPAEQ